VLIHTAQNLAAGVGKLKVLSRRAIFGRLAFAFNQAVDLQTGLDWIDIALADFEAADALEFLHHFIAVASAVLQEVEDNNFQQPLTQLYSPIIQIQLLPLSS